MKRKSRQMTRDGIAIVDFEPGFDMRRSHRPGSFMLEGVLSWVDASGDRVELECFMRVDRIGLGELFMAALKCQP